MVPDWLMDSPSFAHVPDWSRGCIRGVQGVRSQTGDWVKPATRQGQPKKYISAQRDMMDLKGGLFYF